MARPRDPKPFRLTVVRWVDAEGQRVPSGTPGAKKETSQSATWYADLYPDGKRHRISLETTDQGEAWINLRKKLREQADRAAGITDPYTDHMRTPIAEHLAAWQASLNDAGRSDHRRALLLARVRRLVELAGWTRLGDISAASAASAVGRLAKLPSPNMALDAHGKRLPGRSASTRNSYLGHLKQFVLWCIADRRLRDNPLVGLRPVDVRSDRRHDRRVPTEEEVERLFAKLAGAPERQGVSAACRALGYKVAMASGLRLSELCSLRRESFDLDAGTVTLSAAYDKRRRQAVQRLPPWLVEELRAWFAGGGAVWTGLPRQRMADLLKQDLAFAHIPYRIEGASGPLFFDFHSLRVWYITQLANQPGISIKTLVTLARHSNPELSIQTYAKSRQADLQASVDLIPKPGNSGCTE